jgi:hypothetical protein
MTYFGILDVKDLCGDKGWINDKVKVSTRYFVGGIYFVHFDNCQALIYPHFCVIRWGSPLCPPLITGDQPYPYTRYKINIAEILPNLII